MSTKLTRRKIFAVMFASVIAVGQTGCQSGWKMPSASIFPWSKKPSESTLAGSNPSLTAPTTKTGSFASTSGGPTSPASNNTPALLSSATPRGSSPYGGAMGGNRSTIPTASDFTTPQSNPNAGLAANANGYQTGPYSMAGNRTGLTAPSPYGGASSLASNPPPAGFAPATGFNAATNAPQSRPTNTAMAYVPPQQQPQFANAGLPAAPGFAPNGLPPQQQPAMVASNSGPANASFANPGLPSASGLPGTGMTTSNMAPSNVMPSNMVPAVPAGMSSTNMASLPPATPTYSMPNAAPASFQPQGTPAATASYAGASPYRPGSTSRSTAYDFSKQPTSGASAVPHTATGLPPAPATNLYR